MRAALAAVKGVGRAGVVFERHEAYVEYDPTQCSVEMLLAAVAAAKDPNMPVVFRAAVKK